MTDAESLLRFLDCDTLDLDVYSGRSKDFGVGNIYGGQVFAQAVRAAQLSVDEGRFVHSAHGYFVRAGDPSEPVQYEVERHRDGRSFSSRRVVAIQHSRQIFHLSASFEAPDSGPSSCEPVSLPLSVLRTKIAEPGGEYAQFQADFLYAFVLKPEERTSPNAFQMWVKTRFPVCECQQLHDVILAYISDMGMVMSMVFLHEPQLAEIHADVLDGMGYFTTSLDHAIWYHRPIKVDDWFFYDCRAKTTGHGRGYAQGRIYSKHGILVASTSQEGLLRKLD